MSKNWYPVIDILECIECGTCIAHCASKQHFVYDKQKAPTPVVARPECCVDHCHGCGSKCPVGAITYVGDNTGWTPPHGTPKESAGCCCGK